MNRRHRISPCRPFLAKSMTKAAQSRLISQHRLSAQYSKTIRAGLLPYSQARMAPFLGVALLVASVAHASPDQLGAFAYVTALFAIVSAPLSLPLSAAGNVVADQRRQGLDSASVFPAGFTFALLLAGVLVVLSVLMYANLHQFSGYRTLGGDTVVKLSLMLMPALPLLVINTYLHVYHEAAGQARFCSWLRSSCVLGGLVYLGVAASLVPADRFVFYAMAYPVLIEVIQLVGYVWLSYQKNLSFKLARIGSVGKTILQLGLPLSIGLCGQRIYGALLNERLAGLNAQLVADLAVYMSVLGILTVPVAAFSQLHSVYVSRSNASRRDLYQLGMPWIAALAAVLTLLLLLGGPGLFYLFGGDTTPFTSRIFLTLALSVASMCALGLITAQLRALKDALRPQLIVLSVTFLGVLPAIYLVDLTHADLDTVLRIDTLLRVPALLYLHRRAVRLSRQPVDLAHEVRLGA